MRALSEIKPDGNFAYSYETSDGSRQDQSGHDGVVTGSASWTSPDGAPVEIKYVADENGYQPTGEILPTPHPIPEAIQRALEWIAAHPVNE